MFQPKNCIKALGIIAIACIFSCRDKNLIEIDGDIKGLKSQMAYISNNYPVGSKPFDSCKVTNGKFSFKFKPDTVFEPRLVQISFNDHKLFVGVIDPYSPKNKYGAFILERGITQLTGDLAKSNGLTINAGPQNEFYFKQYNLPFIDVSKDSVKREAQVGRFVSNIRTTPDAYWAMFAMGNWKFEVTKAELAQLFNAFDEQTKNSYSGKQIKKFLANKLDEAALKPNALLTDDKGNKAQLIDTTKKLNMVIFWASWCGPCRLEIPSLKKLATKYKGTNLRMVSVSIDKDKTQWKQALDVEKMQWQQLCIDNNDLPKLISQYNLGWIPQVYFMDNNRKIVKHVDGFDPTNDAVFDKTISEALKTN